MGEAARSLSRFASRRRFIADYFPKSAAQLKALMMEYEPFGVVLGGNSLVSQRSGVGRMTMAAPSPP
ncbi:MAG TPA: hypothetical protein VE650_16060, partial [Acetobacteraceae bacterium]|nr:hypothetical protein [Acetobacteraceae bacterium]